eukprot:scaffold126857_cov33-Phaeocystis_antarctica.AAC.1
MPEILFLLRVRVQLVQLDVGPELPEVEAAVHSPLGRAAADLVRVRVRVRVRVGVRVRVRVRLRARVRARVAADLVAGHTARSPHRQHGLP